eukprot:TRINITY_DN822_c0_g2_i1.p1 TRINITY_DN822_c0_g2~~TRINITY_DN822_c0_g2_i1.p1  ORF type:complete len:429 (+),score=54.33 TRINITY_DN822_c0_g2_i1:243-1529(+)
MKVAIIGGGMSGLSACRFLSEAGHRPTIFEMSDGLGGIWKGNKAGFPALYKQLRTNLPHQVMQCHDVCFDDCGSDSYRGIQEMLRYTEKYATAFSLHQYAVTKTMVTEAAFSEVKGNWTITTKNLTTSERFVDIFDFVVVANGHHSEPFIPKIEGAEQWLATGSATSIHSSKYREPSPYVGKTVLIVGANFSGQDITEQVHKVADEVLITDLQCLQVSSKTNRTMLPAKGTVISETGHLIHNGTKISDNPITDIIYASGFKYSFPFLDLPSLGLQLIKQGKFLSGLDVFQLFPTKASTSRAICFLGLQIGIVPFPLFESQARFVAAVLSKKADEVNFPTKTFSLAPKTHILGGNQWDYVLELDRRACHESAKNTLRVNTVRQLFDETIDGAKRLVPFPGDPGVYRHARFTVDWETGKWQVSYKPPSKL